MTDICVICQGNLPIRKPLIRRSSRLKERVIEEEELNLFHVGCCHQSFHATCFLQSLQNNINCPLCRASFLPEPEQPIIVYQNHPPANNGVWRYDLVVYAIILALTIILIWTLYFIASEWYANGLLYIAKMFGAVLVIVVTIFTLSYYLQIHDSARA